MVQGATRHFEQIPPERGDPAFLTQFFILCSDRFNVSTKLRYGVMRVSNVPPASSLTRGWRFNRFRIDSDRFRNVRSLSAGYSPYENSPPSSTPSPVPLNIGPAPVSLCSCMSGPTGPPDGLRVTFLRLCFVTRGVVGCAILARHFSWGQESWQEPAMDPSRGWACGCPVSIFILFFDMERRLWSHRTRSARAIEVLRARRR
jgi:hypothetical protein